MAEFKLVIGNPKDGKSYQIEAKDTEAKPLLGLVIGDKIKGDNIGLAGYEFEITGGSDYCGFPMRKDVLGSSRKRILAPKSLGIRNVKKGILIRRTMAGNTVHQNTAQINMKVIKTGKSPLESSKPKEEKKK